jgi:hypothetical protein
MPGLAEPTPKGQFSLYDLVDAPKAPLAHFDTLTGGEQVISMVKYNVMDDAGNVTTKFMPGQTSFEPMVLLRSMDVMAKQLNLQFQEAVLGKIKGLKRNLSVSMNDSNGKPLVWWHLNNVLPLKISGFDFNMTTEAEYTSFEITLQAESIVIEFESEATEDAIKESIAYWTAKEAGEEPEESEEPEEPEEEPKAEAQKPPPKVKTTKAKS